MAQEHLNDEIVEMNTENEIDGSDLTDDHSLPGDLHKKNLPITEIFEFFEMLILAACAIIFFFNFVARICTVDGPSMNKTLEHGDKLIVSDLFYTPKQGDIVVFQDLELVNPGTQKPLYENAIIKRVIATGGQEVALVYETVGSIVEVKVFVDGALLEEPYRYYDTAPDAWKDRYTGRISYQVPEGCLFVMGDNTYHSEDSRGKFAFVEEEKVLGRVVFRLGGADFSSLFEKFGFVA